MCALDHEKSNVIIIERFAYHLRYEGFRGELLIELQIIRHLALYLLLRIAFEVLKRTNCCHSRRDLPFFKESSALQKIEVVNTSYLVDCQNLTLSNGS